MIQEYCRGEKALDFHILLTDTYRRTATIIANHHHWRHCQRSRWKETKANSDACRRLHRPVNSLPCGRIPGYMPSWTTLFTTKDFNTTRSTTTAITSTNPFEHSSRNILQRATMANNTSARAQLSYIHHLRPSASPMSQGDSDPFDDSICHCCHGL